MTVDQAKDLKQLDIWKETCLEIDKLIKFEESKFRTCKPEEVVAIQNKIKVYESVKNLPQTVIDRDDE